MSRTGDAEGPAPGRRELPLAAEAPVAAATNDRSSASPPSREAAAAPSTSPMSGCWRPRSRESCGGDLLCIACRYTHPIADEVWDFQGACAPIPIRSSIEGGHLVVERAVLEKAARYF